MSVKIRRKGDYLYLDIYEPGGRRHWERLGLRVPKDIHGRKEVLALAETIRRKREIDVVSGRFLLADPHGKKLHLIEYAEQIAAEYDKKMHLPKSLKYLRPYAGAVLIGDVDERFVDGYRAFLQKQPTMGQRTAQHYFDAFKALLSRAERERMIERNPAKGAKTIRAPEVKKPYLNIDEIQKLYDTPVTGGDLAHQCRTAFLLSCFTGLRLGDLKSLAWGDIQRGDDPAIVKRMNKTGDIVYVPLSPSAWALIDDKGVHRADELLFPRMTATQAVNVHQPLISWRKRAGIDRAFGWHAGRHSFAMMTLEASNDIYAVARLLGHADVKITSVYLRLTDPRKREIIASLPAIDTTVKGTIIPMAENA